MNALQTEFCVSNCEVDVSQNYSDRALLFLPQFLSGLPLELRSWDALRKYPERSSGVHKIKNFSLHG